MEEIKGVDLCDLIAEIDEEDKKERKAFVKTKIRHVKNQINVYANELEVLRKQLSKTQDKYNKAIEKLEDIRLEDWDVLDDIKLNNENTKGM